MDIRVESSNLDFEHGGIGWRVHNYRRYQVPHCASQLVVDTDVRIR
jgi:hypothetical protein